jgi:trk system potassium uptake protein TrkH
VQGSPPIYAMMADAMQRRPLSPPQVLAVSFGALILTGAALLSLPVATATGAALSFVDALFTSTSAVCVTGLIVVDTPHALSTFGQVVVLALIQAGGLGYMTLSTIVAIALGKRMTIQERLVLREALNLESMEGLVRFVMTVVKVTVAFELAGAVILTWRWSSQFPLEHAAYLGIFHAVSAFNNAGFSLFSTSLVSYAGDPVVNFTVAGLIICGGIGFLVLSEMGRFRRWVTLSLHTRVALVATGLLLVTSTLGVFLLERHNPATLGGLSGHDAWMAAFFQAVTARTAGFNTVDIGRLTHPTLFLLMALMFVGAAPGGTAGGIKVTTLAVTVVALWATMRGRLEAVLFKRRLPPELVARAFFISLTAFMALNVIAALILIVEHQKLVPALFETTSAFGTVGLSMSPPGSAVSLSGGFSYAGKLLVTAMMFMGRVGPLTLAVAVVGRRTRERLRYPEGKVLIG